jgi:hypothetical protein
MSKGAAGCWRTVFARLHKAAARAPQDQGADEASPLSNHGRRAPCDLQVIWAHMTLLSSAANKDWAPITGRGRIRLHVDDPASDQDRALKVSFSRLLTQKSRLLSSFTMISTASRSCKCNSTGASPVKAAEISAVDYVRRAAVRAESVCDKLTHTETKCDQK